MSNRIFDKLQQENPNKYPSRMGKPWLVDEEKQLLSEVQKKIPHDIMAELHERTTGAIVSKLRAIAADYHFNNNLQIEEIQKYTGLSLDQISDAISKRKIQHQVKIKEKTKRKQQVAVVEQPLSDTKEMISLLKDIKGLLQTFLNNIHYEE